VLERAEGVEPRGQVVALDVRDDELEARLGDHPAHLVRQARGVEPARVDHQARAALGQQAHRVGELGQEAARVAERFYLQRTPFYRPFTARPDRVPRFGEGLLDVLRGFPAFIICFAILMTFWTAHFRYHRRYGLEDWVSRVLTMAILVLVLFFVYPLKYLFTMLTVQVFGLHMHEAPGLESAMQNHLLYTIYGLGFASVWGLYALLYWHALRRRDELQLNEVEILLTRADLAANFIYVGVCLLSVTLAWTVEDPAIPGLVYWLLAPLQAFTGRHFGKKAEALAAIKPE